MALTGAAMKPVRVEIITYTPTTFYHCQHCEVTFQGIGVAERVHREQALAALPADLQWEFEVLSDRVHDLMHRYGRRLSVKVIDAASIEGVWKSLRYGVRRYPAVVIDGTEKHAGADAASLDTVIERHLAAASEG